MTKKTFFHSLAMMMAAMMMAACSNDDVAGTMGNNTQQSRSWQVSINAGPAAGTRAISVGGNNGQTLYTNWDANDAVEVVKDGASVGTLNADVSEGNSAYATLTGTLTGTFSVGDEVTLYYHTAALDYTGQVGTIAGVSTNKSYLTATSTVKSVDGSGGFLSMSDAAFSSMQAYLDLSFSDGTNPISISSLDIWADGGKLVKTKALNGTTTYATETEPLTITPASATDKFFIALRDENGAANDYHFKATTTYDTYYYEGSKNLEWGKFYSGTVTMTSSYKMLSAATAEDIGKVVCSAGELHDAKTAVPAGHTAVGILGKVTSTGHGLILALQDASNQTWTTIDGWTSTDAYAGTTLKVLPDNAARNNLTSYTALGGTAVSNWAVAQKGDYEAIFQNLGSEAIETDGYLYDGNVNAYLTTGVGGTALSGAYWSATSAIPAWSFDSFWWANGNHDYNSYQVRPVLGF